MMYRIKFDEFSTYRRAGFILGNLTIHCNDMKHIIHFESFVDMGDAITTLNAEGVEFKILREYPNKVLEAADVTIEDLEAAKVVFDKLRANFHPTLCMFFSPDDTNKAWMTDTSRGLQHLINTHGPKFFYWNERDPKPKQQPVNAEVRTAPGRDVWTPCDCEPDKIWYAERRWPIEGNEHIWN